MEKRSSSKKSSNGSSHGRRQSRDGTPPSVPESGRTGSGSSIESEEITCGICFEKVVEQGKLNSCAHNYCFVCIEQWSKTENTCPLCKKRFKSLTKLDLSSRNRRPQTVRVEEANQRPEDVPPMSYIEIDDSFPMGLLSPFGALPSMTELGMPSPLELMYMMTSPLNMLLDVPLPQPTELDSFFGMQMPMQLPAPPPGGRYTHTLTTITPNAIITSITTTTTTTTTRTSTSSSSSSSSGRSSQRFSLPLPTPTPLPSQQHRRSSTGGQHRSPPSRSSSSSSHSNSSSSGNSGSRTSRNRRGGSNRDAPY